MAEVCPECGGEIEYVAARSDGEGVMPHCWECYYAQHPERIPTPPNESETR